jgi:hypothetical protein
MKIYKIVKQIINHYLSEIFFIFYSYQIKFVHIRLTFRHIPDQPPHTTRRQTISSQILSFNNQRDSSPLKKLDKPKENLPIIDVPPSISNTLCPLCEIPFDTVGIHRPVNDACGHTTCFQCFKKIMIKATGCSLCQKEEEINTQIFDDDSVRKIFFLI